MRGKVLSFDNKKKEGILIDKNHQEYTFHIEEEVKFEIGDIEAVNIMTHSKKNLIKLTLYYLTQTASKKPIFIDYQKA